MPYQKDYSFFLIITEDWSNFSEAYETAREVLGITLTRTSRKYITAQMAGFPHHALDSYLPRLVRAGKRVAICDEPNKVAEKVEPAKKATRKSAKKESK
jgi:DNA mismatch repair ATPase MutS